MGKKRCSFAGCKVKLKLSDVECRCKLKFCSKHRLPEQHQCSIDYKNLNNEAFIKKAGLEGLPDNKVIKI